MRFSIPIRNTGWLQSLKADMKRFCVFALAAGLLVRSATASKRVKWEELEAKTAYGYRKRLVKEADAADHLALAPQ